MKQLIIAMLLLCTVGSLATAQSQTVKQELKGTIKVNVDGLSCPFCAYGLEKKLKKMDGVTKIEIDVPNAFALLTIADGKSVSEELIRDKVKDAGFTAREIKEVTNEK